MSSPIDHSNIFVLVPAYNEAETIVAVLQELLAYHFTVVVVDDGSTQDIYSLVKHLPVFYIRHEVNLGQGAALQTGIDFALYSGASYIVTFDGDGQHQAADVERLVDYLIQHPFDIILGSRFLEQTAHDMPLKRKYLLKLARYLNFLFTGLLLSDTHNGLRVMTSETAALLDLKENRMAHATEILSRIKTHRLRYKELPVKVIYTLYTRQKGQDLWSGFRIIFDLLLKKIFG